MISCQQAHNLFEDYLNDELSAALTAELDAHRLECDACRHQLTLMEACGNVVRLDTNEPHVSADFTDRLMAILDEDQGRRGWLQIDRRLKVACGLLGVAAAIALVVLFYPADSPEIAAEQVQPEDIRPLPAADLVTGLPIELLFNATNSFSSAVELGHLGLNQVSGPSETGQDATSPGYPDLEILPAQREPQLDVIELLPDLDDGGELM